MGMLLVNSTTEGQQQDPTVAFLADGSYVVVWTDGELYGPADSVLRARLFSADGAPQGDEFLINSSAGSHLIGAEVTALESGGFAVAWTRSVNPDWIIDSTDSSSIWVQVFDETGGAVGGPSQIADSEYRPGVESIASLEGGGFVVTWSDSSGPQYGESETKAQVFTDNGAPVGGPIHVNTATADSQVWSNVTGLSSGGFLVTWTDVSARAEEGSIAFGDIKGQIYTHQGAPVGGEFLINSSTDWFQDVPSALGLTDGGFAVVWEDDVSGQNSTVKLQLFNAAGAKVGGELLVATESYNSIYDPQITPLESGGYLVSWITYPGDDIRAQEFDGNWNKVGLLQVIAYDTLEEYDVAPGSTPIFVWDDVDDDGSGIWMTGPDLVISDVTLTRAPELPQFALGNVLTEMAQLALEAYEDDSDEASDRGWRPLSAFELGIPASNPSTSEGAYTFADGVFTVMTFDGLLWDAFGQVQVLVGRVEGKTTVTLAFRGTDSAQDVTTYFPFSETYEYFSPLIDAVKDFIADHSIEQVLITGHSLGAAMAQTALSADFPLGYDVEVFNFASPGSNIGASNPTLLTTFVRDSDPVPDLGAAGLNSINGSIITTSGTPDWAPHPHSMAAYVADIQHMVALAFDPNNTVFYAHPLAATLRDGALWTDIPLQINPGSSSNDRIVSTADDDLVVSGAGNDAISIRSGSPNLVLDAGSGPSDQNDKVFLYAGGTYSRTEIAGGYEIFRNGTSIGKFYGVDQFYDFNGPLWGGIVQKPSSQQLQRVEAKAYASVPTFAISAGYAAADAGNGAMKVVGTSGDDVIFAGMGNKTIQAGHGDDIVTIRNMGTEAQGDVISIDGGTGADLMFGGRGAETFFVDNVGDRIEDWGGTDLIRTSVSYILPAGIENIRLEGGASIHATGNSLANRIYGNSSANTLDGSSGADVIYGGAGDDTYILDNSGDTTIELLGEGLDTVFASRAHNLKANVENLVMTGIYSITSRGNELTNVITGNSGSNRLWGEDGNDTLIGNGGSDQLDGGAGDDTLTGGIGNDIYFVDSASDTVTEAVDEGRDTVRSSIGYTLGTDVEWLELQGSANINGTGNGHANVLKGNGGANNLAGLGGNDKLYAGAGSDVVNGGEGGDWLEGGIGRDEFTGGAGSDRFVFREGDFGGNTIATADLIHDFVRAQGDKIRLDLVDANTTAAGNQAFVFLGTGGFTSIAGQLRFEQSGGNTFVQGDINGDGIADFVIHVDGTLNFVGGDFIL